MSNHASTISIVPVAAASAPTHGDRRDAATAVARKNSARPVSNPDHARSQRSVTWWCGSDDDSQIVHGSRPTPIAANVATTQCRSVRGKGGFMACLHCRK